MRVVAVLLVLLLCRYLRQLPRRRVVRSQSVQHPTTSCNSMVIQQLTCFQAPRLWVQVSSSATLCHPVWAWLVCWNCPASQQLDEQRVHCAAALERPVH